MFKGFASAIQAYFGAFAIISRLRLWKFFAIPIVITVLTAFIIGITAYGYSDNLGHWLMGLWPWEWGAEWVEGILTVFSGLVIIIIGLIIFKHVILAFSAPFMSPVSEAIETYLNPEANHQHRDSSFMAQLWRGTRLNMRNLFMELLLTIPILILGLIPVVNILTAVLLFLVQAYYAGFGNMDYTLERHYGYRESINFVRKNRGTAIGNGTVFMIFLLLPVIGVILVLPLSVTAATVRTVKLIHER